MAITDYATLQSAIANWLHRSDLGTVIPDFIALAEQELSNDLDAREMEARVNLVTIAGEQYVDLPTDVLEMRRLSVQSDPVQVLKYITPDELSDSFSPSFTDMPFAFSVIGGQLQLSPTPDTEYTLELAYKQRIPALSDSATTNWLLSAYPSAYLYASLLAAQPYIMNDERLAVIVGLYDRTIAGINKTEWYSGSTMRVRAK